MKNKLSKIMIIVTVILMDILAGAEMDLFVPSFPELQEIFSLSPFWVEMLLSINFLGIFVGLFFVGPLSDRYGRKPIIIYGLLIFIIGSLLCVYASTYAHLFIGRLLQGIGVSAPASLCFLIIADNYPIKEQQFMMAMLNGIVNATIGIAPVAGSYITLYFHWQGNFRALLLMGLVVLSMSIFFLPVGQKPEHKDSLSLRGYVAIIRNTPLMILMLTLVFLFAPYWVFAGIAPILYISDLGVSLAHYGYYQGMFAAVFAIGSFLFGMVLSRYEQHKMVLSSMYIFIASLICIGLAALFNISMPLLITVAVLIFVIGQIIPSVILYPVMLNHLPSAKGKVASMLRMGVLILTACSLQLTGYLYSGSFRNIGIILFVLILIGVLGLGYVMKENKKVP